MSDFLAGGIAALAVIVAGGILLIFIGFMGAVPLAALSTRPILAIPHWLAWTWIGADAFLLLCVAAGAAE